MEIQEGNLRAKSAKKLTDFNFFGSKSFYAQLPKSKNPLFMRVSRIL